jgi:hypothetical protein
MSMDGSQLPPGVSWRVTSQQEGTQPGPAGTYTKGVTVYFNVSTGDSGSVFIPNNMYTSDNVIAAVNARAAQLAEISQLTSG